MAKLMISVEKGGRSTWKFWVALITMPIWAPICILAFWIANLFECITEGVPDEYTNDEH